MQYLYLFTALLFNLTGNITMKLAALQGLDLTSFSPIDLFRKHWLAVLAITLYGTSAIFYFLSLRTFPLSIAYPVIVFLSFVGVQLFAIFALHEQVALWQIIGYILVIAGITLVLVCKP